MATSNFESDLRRRVRQQAIVFVLSSSAFRSFSNESNQNNARRTKDSRTKDFMQWLAEVCVKRPVFATMLILSLVTVGAFSFFSSRRRSFSEDRLSDDYDHGRQSGRVAAGNRNRSDGKNRRSGQYDQRYRRAALDFGRRRLAGFRAFVLEKDVNVAAQEVENRVQTVIPNLPETAEQPTVQKLDTRCRAGSAHRRFRADQAARRDGSREKQNQGTHRISQRRRSGHDDRRARTADQRLG